ncbi:MAG TPA: Fur family transcriptional regulator [Rhodoblastus sp.]|nr:Fur family transcriptional regulator [Rhodoblastus sp.]
MSANAATHWRKSSFCATLRDQGLRPTRQRVQIAELLFAKGDRHLTAETLFAEAREQRYPPSLATIYNALRDFAAHGLVREIALYGAKTWYDTKIGPHFHFYLEDRDELFDIPEQYIPLMNVPAPDGTEIVGVDVVIRLAPKDGASVGASEHD